MASHCRGDCLNDSAEALDGVDRLLDATSYLATGMSAGRRASRTIGRRRALVAALFRDGSGGVCSARGLPRFDPSLSVDGNNKQACNEERASATGTETSCYRQRHMFCKSASGGRIDWGPRPSARQLQLGCTQVRAAAPQRVRHGLFRRHPSAQDLKMGAVGGVSVGASEVLALQLS